MHNIQNNMQEYITIWQYSKYTPFPSAESADKY